MHDGVVRVLYMSLLWNINHTLFSYETFSLKVCTNDFRSITKHFRLYIKVPTALNIQPKLIQDELYSLFSDQRSIL